MAATADARTNERRERPKLSASSFIVIMCPSPLSSLLSSLVPPLAAPD
jgi:hypothetical protein